MTPQEKKRIRFFEMLETERERQQELHPKGMYDIFGYPNREVALTVLIAKVGELAHAIEDEDRDRQIKKAMQIAAVALRMYEEVL